MLNRPATKRGKASRDKTKDDYPYWTLIPVLGVCIWLGFRFGLNL